MRRIGLTARSSIASMLAVTVESVTLSDDRECASLLATTLPQTDRTAPGSPDGARPTTLPAVEPAHDRPTAWAPSRKQRDRHHYL